MPADTTAPYPFVVPGDDGIRPAGPDDSCFYCGSKVGERHGPKCVCVKRNVVFGVHFDGAEIGEWTYEVPAHWDEHACLFWTNDSSWCADNMDSCGKYEGEPLPEVDTGGCLCELLSFTVKSMGTEIGRSTYD